MATSILDIGNNVQRSFLMGQQQGQQSLLQSLAPKIMQGDPQAYAQAAAIDPQAAQGYQSAGDSQLRKLQGFIKYVDNARASGNPMAVNAALRAGGPLISQLSGKPAPTEWTPEMDQGWEFLKARVATLGNAPQQPNQNKVVGGALVTPDGQVVYQAPVNTALVDVPVPGGTMKMVYNPQTQQLSPLPTPGASGDPGMTQIQTANGPVNLGNDLTPDQLAAAQQDMAAPGGINSVQMPPRDVSPGQFGAASGGFGFKPADAGITPYQQQMLALQQASAGRAANADARAQEAADRAARGTPPAGMRWNAAGTALEPIPGAPAPASNASEGERNAAGFYQRMVAANAEMKALTDKGYDPTNLRDFASAGGTLGNFFATPNGQQYRQAAMNWVRANLRKESGAAIGQDEAAQEIRNYFPMPGDSPQVIAQKERNRAVTEDAMRQAAGRAAPNQTQQQARTIVRSGTLNGRRIVQYSDGTADYAD